MNRIVALLGRGVVPADTPLLRADDLGVVRGDGIFETLHVLNGTPWLLDEHLARLVNSAARLDLALPPLTELIELVRQACAPWPAGVEGALRLVCTRGPESGGAPTIFATIGEIPAKTIAAREEGVSVGTISLGVDAAARATAPWLLGGVKSISYAMNMTCLRWAAANGYDDALWVSADGYVLEAPTSTLIWRSGSELLTVPTVTGILPGTTGRFLLDHAGKLGLTAGEAMVTPGGLAAAEGVWLASSVRGLAEVHTIDGVRRAPAAETGELRHLLGF